MLRKNKMHFLTVYDIGKKKTRIGKDVMVGLDGEYDLCVFVGKGECHLPHLRHPENVPWHGQEKNVLLRLDIETLEWMWLDTLDMSKIKQLLVEFYFPFDPAIEIFQTIGNPYIPSVPNRIRILERLCQTHWLVHLHPNNCYGTTTYYGITYPNVFQCAYVRKDQTGPSLPISTHPIPDPITDAPNVDGPDIGLVGEPFWCRSSLLATVLGSCRQTPLASYMRISSIQERLNYPHYTKEMLQQILFLKNSDIHADKTRFIFRKGLLSQCREIVDPTLYRHLQDEFMGTDIFLLEIASRIYYRWNGYYLHHIAQDPHYQFPYCDEMSIGDLTDAEIEDDLHEIRKALYPKKFMVISHFASYPHGKRYDLIQLLKRLCHQMDISFWDQSHLIEQYGTDIIKDNCHFTEEGSRLAGNILYQQVQRTIFSYQRTMYNIYYTDDERVAKYTFHGLGDFLRGTIYLFQECRKNGVQFKVNFSNHHLGNVLVCDNHLSVPECQNARYFFASEHTDVDMQCQHVFSNKFPTEPMDNECRDFLREQCLRPRLSLEKKLSDYMKQLTLVEKEYIVLHVRLYDEETYDLSRLQSISRLIQMIHHMEPQKTLLFLASSKCYHPHLHTPFLVKTDLQSGHLGLPSTTLQQTEDTMIEFMLMTKCSKIYQASVYGWGSGFSEIVHQVYQVPLEKLQLT